MEPWQHQYRNAMSDGEMCLSQDDPDGALECYRKAFSLIPEPKDSHRESTMAITGFGNCYLKKREYELAEQAFRDVLLCPGAPANPYVRLRRGETYFHLGDLKKARMEFTVAYMNGGADALDLADEPPIRELIREVIKELDGKVG